MTGDLSELRERLRRLEGGGGPASVEPFPLGPQLSDITRGEALGRGLLHEVFAAAGSDAAAASGFSLGVALRAADERPILWARQEFIDSEAGWLSGLGLSAFGLAPERLVTVRARDATGVLRAIAEGARCQALGAVIGEIWGDPPVVDLTATRRLSMASRGSGVTSILLRLGSSPRPSAAETRWRVKAAPSVPLEAGAPGAPAFDVALLRHRAGLEGRDWHLEWDRDSRAFRELSHNRGFARPSAPLPRPAASLPAGRPAPADAPALPLRKAG